MYERRTNASTAVEIFSQTVGTREYRNRDLEKSKS